MRIATSLAVMLAATILPMQVLPAQAQHGADPAASHGISTSHSMKGSSRAYRTRGYHRHARGQSHGYARGYTRSHARAHARSHSRGHAHRHAHGAGSAGASRGCLSGDTRNLLSRFEARFGSVKVISTCRPGAVIAGSGRPSQHRYGKAVDFMPNPGQRTAMLSWLRSNANGAVITYGSGHIHFDTGGYRNFAVSAKARRSYARAR